MLVIFTANHTYGICLNTVETASFLACSYFFLPKSRLLFLYNCSYKKDVFFTLRCNLFYYLNPIFSPPFYETAMVGLADVVELF